MSANKDLLVCEGVRENKQVFEQPPNLMEFARLLRIITEEIVQYRVWPVRFLRRSYRPSSTDLNAFFDQENCWFFCSLLQQHLEGLETGWFKDGELRHANLAKDIRSRVYGRVRANRITPFALQPSSPELHAGVTAAPHVGIRRASVEGSFNPHYLNARFARDPENNLGSLRQIYGMDCR